MATMAVIICSGKCNHLSMVESSWETEIVTGWSSYWELVLKCVSSSNCLNSSRQHRGKEACFVLNGNLSGLIYSHILLIYRGLIWTDVLVDLQLLLLWHSVQLPHFYLFCTSKMQSITTFLRLQPYKKFRGTWTNHCHQPRASLYLLKCSLTEQ